MSFYYHGSLNEERLPFTVLEALKRVEAGATLTIVGYETAGSKGFMREFLARAAAFDVDARVHYLGSLASRADMFAVAEKSDVGIAFMPIVSQDINMRHMTGASNKPFDYMAAGQFLLVSDLPDWRTMFVDGGYALACNPHRVDDLTNAMRWCIEHPDEVRKRGERCRLQILSEWNYETVFAPVAERMVRSVVCREGSMEAN